MNYKAILKYLAEKENVSVHEIEEEMQKAICCTGLNCSAEEFIKAVSEIIIKDYI
ncbi:MAG: hypothetical protein IKM66_09080 [Clostridia bacterium]|nr:hypothetical protein [Clostridia bacterium]